MHCFDQKCPLSKWEKNAFPDLYFIWPPSPAISDQPLSQTQDTYFFSWLTSSNILFMLSPSWWRPIICKKYSRKDCVVFWYHVDISHYLLCSQGVTTWHNPTSMPSSPILKMLSHQRFFFCIVLINVKLYLRALF